MHPLMPTRHHSIITLRRVGIVLLTYHGGVVDAAPHHSGANWHVLQPRANETDTNNPPQPSGLTVQVWAPLVAITVAIIFMILFSCIKRRKAASVAAATANNGARADGSTTELTAELLSAASGATPTPNRRPRRTRRTPSQISTRSLPAYMEDPGDSEMVLVRGAREMEDPMPTVQEGEGGHNASASLGSLGDMSNTSQNSQTNLLIPESISRQPTRPSIETIQSVPEDDQQRLLQSSRHSREPSAEEIRARGEAPPYFEVVGAADLTEGMEMQGLRSTGASGAPDATQASSDTRETLTSEAAHAREATETNSSLFSTSTIRRSGFRSLASRLSQLLPSSSSYTSTTSPESQTAGPTTSPTAPAHTRHRSSNSGSGSAMALTTTISQIRPRSIRSMRSNPSLTNLTSPSATSLGPISAPLPHTLVRTEFEYPKDGPTSEQMKFISSRETLGKYAVPYGLAAQAQALASREAIAMTPDTDPPPFESPVREAGPSAARSADDGAGPSSSGPDQSPHPPADSGSAPSVALLGLDHSGTATSDASTSRSSIRDSITTYLTAIETLSSFGDEPKDDARVETESRTRTRTPTPTNAALTINIEGVATKSVPTPPPTPPRQSLIVPGPEIPSIIIAPASPAT